MLRHLKELQKIRLFSCAIDEENLWVNGGTMLWVGVKCDDNVDFFVLLNTFSMMEESNSVAWRCFQEEEDVIIDDWTNKL